MYQAKGVTMHKQFYGFSEEPFAINPDNDFCYLAPSHQEVLSSLKSGIVDRKGIMFITGEEGTGKTILLRQLVQMLDPSVKAVLISNPSESFVEVLKGILHDLELPPGEPDKSSMLSQFHEYLYRGLSRDETVLIVVDDAHEMSAQVLEELRMLCNPDPRIPGPGSVQEIFAGRPEFEEKLQSRELRQVLQRVAVRCRLQPLSEIEIQQYIDHRLNKVGSGKNNIFTPDAVDLICRYSRGIPRSINMLCYMAVCGGYALSRKEIGSDLVEKVFPVLNGHRLGGWKGVAGSVKALADNFKKSPVITKITYSLLAYSFLALFIVFLLNLLF
jgi:general secretion pathway protein A